jgi:hypothetical protein
MSMSKYASQADYWKDKFTAFEQRHLDLQDAIEAVYFAAYWHPDRPVENEQALWTVLRDAAGIEPGQTAKKLGPDRSTR